MLNTMNLIRLHGSGLDIEKLQDPSFVAELNEIVRYFGSMSGELTEILEEAADNLKRYLDGGKITRSQTLFEFQDMIKTATSTKRRRLQEEREMTRRNARYDVADIVKSDLTDEEKIAQIHAIMLKMEGLACQN